MNFRIKKHPRLFRILCIFLTLVLCEFIPHTYVCSYASEHSSIKVLLVGNSYTQKNNMGKMLKKIGKSCNTLFTVTTLAADGVSLADYADSKNSLGKKFRKLIKNKHWDYVILQDKRTRPLTDVSGMEKDTTTLCRIIRKSGARPMLYMTWAPRAGHSDYTKFRSFIHNRSDYQKKILAAYQRAAASAGAKRIPAGSAVIRAENTISHLILEQKDRYHPNQKGSYLVACSIYSALTGKSAYGKQTYTAGIPGKTARVLQKIAWNTCAGIT